MAGAECSPNPELEKAPLRDREGGDRATVRVEGHLPVHVVFPVWLGPSITQRLQKSFAGRWQSWWWGPRCPQFQPQSFRRLSQRLGGLFPPQLLIVGIQVEECGQG